MGKFLYNHAEIVSDFKSGLSRNEVASKHSCSKETVSYVLRKHGIRRTPNDVDLIADYISGQTVDQLSKKYGLLYRVVSERLKKLGYSVPDKRLIYDVNEEFFDNIDTPSKAYWAGFIAADGCVLSRRGISIGLALIDKDHLELFKKDIEFTGPVRILTSSVRHRPDTSYALIKISRAALSDSLTKLGITPNKTFSYSPRETLSHIPPGLHTHFWRGMIDGDGTVSWTKTHKSYPGGMPEISLAGTFDTCQLFIDFCNSLGVHTAAKPRKTKSIFSTSLKANKAFFVISALYGAEGPFLERKKGKANLIISSFKPNKIRDPKDAGICYVSRRDRWVAYAPRSTGKTYLGEYRTKEEAVAARDSWNSK